ncbi:heme utilization cystosolic carrier protein HutX [Mannheimia sp. HC-2023]|uniref:heme utilization cystosolic carrier protein HutX n=1 Tax=Mannheimia TaxID=75984 RepID=UPI00201798AD|nr:heme utilization cystosolic carrier protein HutX [Mannheimia varigena]
MSVLTQEQQTDLRNELNENSGQILEMVASKYQCSLEDVMLNLPPDMLKVTDGERFAEILQEIHEWDDAITFISHTEDAIVEFVGKLPSGSISRGFYNFEHKENGGLQGHLRYENCAKIYLLDRPFRGKRTVSLVFINKKGNAMFKIFVGREKVGGALKEEQIRALYKLIG